VYVVRETRTYGGSRGIDVRAQDTVITVTDYKNMLRVQCAVMQIRNTETGFILHRV